MCTLDKHTGCVNIILRLTLKIDAVTLWKLEIGRFLKIGNDEFGFILAISRIGNYDLGEFVSLTTIAVSFKTIFKISAYNL